MSPQFWPPPGDDSGWVTPTLASGWSVSGETVQYRRRSGIVYLRGRWNGGSGVIFTFPPGFRPAQQLVWRVGNASGTEVLVLRTTGVLEQSSPALASFVNIGDIPSFPADA